MTESIRSSVIIRRCGCCPCNLPARMHCTYSMHHTTNRLDNTIIRHAYFPPSETGPGVQVLCPPCAKTNRGNEQFIIKAKPHFFCTVVPSFGQRSQNRFVLRKGSVVATFAREKRAHTRGGCWWWTLHTRRRDGGVGNSRIIDQLMHVFRGSWCTSQRQRRGRSRVGVRVWPGCIDESEGSRKWFTRRGPCSVKLLSLSIRSILGR